MSLEMSTLGAYALALVPSLSAGVWFWHDKRKLDKHLSELGNKVQSINNKQIEQENKFVTESRTRDIFKEELSPIMRDILEVKTNISNISSTLSDLSGNIMVLTALQDVHSKRGGGEK